MIGDMKLPAHLVRLSAKWRNPAASPASMILAIDPESWGNRIDLDRLSLPGYAKNYWDRALMMDRPTATTAAALNTFQRDDCFWEHIGRPQYDKSFHVEWHIVALALLDAAANNGCDTDEVEDNFSARIELAALSSDSPSPTDYAEALKPFDPRTVMSRPYADDPRYHDYLTFGSALFDVYLDRFRPQPLWDGAIMDEGFRRIYERIGPDFTRHAWAVFPPEAFFFCIEIGDVISTDYLWDVADLWRYWVKKGSVHFTSAREVELFICSYLAHRLKVPEPSCAKQSTSGLPLSIVYADLHIRAFCRRAAVSPIYSPFASAMSVYDEKARSARPTEPTFLSDLAKSAQLFLESRRLRMRLFRCPPTPNNSKSNRVSR